MDKQACMGLCASAGIKGAVEEVAAVSGGDINEAFMATVAGTTYFIKQNAAALPGLFHSEARGLEELSSAGAFAVPQVIACGVYDGCDYLVLEWLDMDRSVASIPGVFGEALASMHGVSRSRCGWVEDNYIGSTRQLNPESDNWQEFFARQRLGYQLELAKGNGLPAKVAQSVCELIGRVGDFFDGYNPGFSLLHGDLWAGNAAVTKTGQPAIFDPAVYYGDRETDLAMMLLFGGFGKEVFSAYDAVFPVHEGFRARKDLYNLYHILNHFNIFGGGYASQVESMAARLLAEVQ